MISSQISKFVQNSSWIRRMFEAGDELRKRIGEENVFDFSLGNPCLEPPQEVIEAWIRQLQSKSKNKHSYTANAGIWETREFIAQRLKQAKSRFKCSFRHSLNKDLRKNQKHFLLRFSFSTHHPLQNSADPRRVLNKF